MVRSLPVAALVAVLVSYLPAPSAAQQNQDYFIPGQPKPAAPAQTPRPGTKPPPPQRPGANPVQVAPPQLGGIAGGAGGAAGPGAQEPPPPPLNVQLPPPPELPPLPKGESPPAAVIGVMGVPDVMRASAAAQQVEKVIGDGH